MMVMVLLPGGGVTAGATTTLAGVSLTGDGSSELECCRLSVSGLAGGLVIEPVAATAVGSPSSETT